MAPVFGLLLRWPWGWFLPTQDWIATPSIHPSPEIIRSTRGHCIRATSILWLVEWQLGCERGIQRRHIRYSGYWYILYTGLCRICGVKILDTGMERWIVPYFILSYLILSKPEERTCHNGFGTGNITYYTHDPSCLVLAMLLITFLQARKAPPQKTID